ncbi:HECT-like ubiquitin-conjugating enzyme-binding-domain-containing protein [Lipomyces arxii]|uniref:HECT-like ubiquitin-conjugating enzyme-binding-domain-containing protein n=1 Tax=Lipomyces arxii TaxID=56418 RepID=UPI0034CD19C5
MTVVYPQHQPTFFVELMPHVAQMAITAAPMFENPSHLTVLSPTSLYFKQTAGSEHIIVDLPGELTKDAPISCVRVCQFDKPTQTLTARLKADRSDRPARVVPLSATDLSSSGNVWCNACKSPLIKQMVKFLDLPSERWQEMLDYWHCHKPGHNHGHEHEHGYSDPVPKTQLVPRSLLVLVGLSYITALASDINCTIKENIVQCSICNAVLGTFRCRSTVY